jgi:hypothetical protein
MHDMGPECLDDAGETTYQSGVGDRRVEGLVGIGVERPEGA